MSKPKIVVLSRNYQVSSELTARLSDTFEFFVCDEMLDVYDILVRNQAAAFVANFQFSLDGGHAQDAFLAELQSRLPSLSIVILTSDNCPEPLERRAACHGLLHVRGHVAVDQIGAWLRNRLQPAPEPMLPAVAPLPDFDAGVPEAETVLSGISRRFETNTPQLTQMLRDLEVAAQHDVTILLIGETGSGKTYLASLIHEVSRRRVEPLYTVACGALPSELIESELFGHVKGAFTSAHADKQGKFVAAGRGTILLDEIDVLGLEQQVKLLRVIETGEFEPVGSNTTMKSQARLVVASNLDLQPLVEQHKFRPDLYYRLNMLKFEIPPLRKRKPDISGLARKFVKQMSEKHNIPIQRIDPGLYDALFSYPWPGNVRELENVIQRAVIYCSDGVLTANHLPSHIVLGVAGPTNDPSVTLTPTPRYDLNQNRLNQQIAVTERELIEQALFKNNFSRTNTAKDLGISRVTLYNKMKKYGMTR